MDNLTHSLVGWALGETGLKRRTRKGLAACILGANMPDIDVFLGWVPWAPLATHRGFTHSLLGGVLLMPPILAGLLWLLDRFQQSRGTQFRSRLPMRFGWLVVLSYLGAVTHPLLDWQNSYAVQFFAPFSDRWYHNDALFIIDPWVLAALAAGIWLSRKRQAGRPATIALTCLCGYISLNGAISEAARAAPAHTVQAKPDAVFASPDPLLFWRRNVVWRQAGAIAQGRFDPLRRRSALLSYTMPVPDNLGDPFARHAMITNGELAGFLRWSVLTTAKVERKGCWANVVFGDARFSSTLAGRRIMEHAAAVDLCAGARLRSR